MLGALIVLMLAIGVPVTIASNSSAAPAVVHNAPAVTLLPLPTITIRIPGPTIVLPPVTIFPPPVTKTVHVPVPGPTRTVTAPVPRATKTVRVPVPGQTKTVTEAPRASVGPTVTVTQPAKKSGTLVPRSNKPSVFDPFDHFVTPVEKGAAVTISIIVLLLMLFGMLYLGYILGHAAGTRHEIRSMRNLRDQLLRK